MNNTEPNNDLKTKIIQALALQDATDDIQNQVVGGIAQAANEKIMLALDELLSPDELDDVQSMKDSGERPDAILDWVENHIPDYPTMLSLTMQDIADELAQAQNASEQLQSSFDSTQE